MLLHVCAYLWASIHYVLFAGSATPFWAPSHGAKAAAAAACDFANGECPFPSARCVARPISAVAADPSAWGPSPAAALAVASVGAPARRAAARCVAPCARAFERAPHARRSGLAAAHSRSPAATVAGARERGVDARGPAAADTPFTAASIVPTAGQMRFER